MSVLLEKRANGVAVVTLNRPQVLNALDVPAKERLGAIWQDIAEDPRVRVAVLTGAGDQAFCAGSDIKEINRTGSMVTTETLMRAMPGVGVPLVKPVIAALHGYCIGMGMTLALHCDLRLAAKNAVIGYPEVKHGMISGVSAHAVAARDPAARALEMMLLARNITADEALRIGLVNAVVDDVQAEAQAWADTIASYSPVAVQATKRLATVSATAERSGASRNRGHARPRRIEGRFQAGRIRLHQACVDATMASMRAVTFANFGAPSVLQATTVERPGPVPTTCSSASMRPASAITTCCRVAARFPAASPAASSDTRSPATIVETGANVPASRVGERVVIYQRLYCGQCRYCLQWSAGPLPQQPRAGRERRGRLRRVHLRAGAQRHPHAGRPRDERGGAGGLPDRHQRARGARCRAIEPGKRC